MTPSIDVIVPTRDGWELTKSCLEHLSRQTVQHTAIVCDNGSSDGTPDRVRSTFPNVRVLELGVNLGFSVACNRGVRAASGEVVVLLNNDVDCRPDFLEQVVAPLADEGVGSVASALLRSGEERIDSFGLAVDSTLAGYPRLRDLPVDAVRAPDPPVLLGPSGAAGAYRRQAWEDVGGLDEGVFMYGEDVELALRLRAAGWLAAAAADAVAVHVGSASASLRSAWQRYQGGFARGYFLRRYGVLRSSAGPRALATEAIVVVGDALVFSHDLAAFRGRTAGWRAGGGRPFRSRPPRDAIEDRITFAESLRLRVGVYKERDPRGRRALRSASTSS